MRLRILALLSAAALIAVQSPVAADPVGGDPVHACLLLPHADGAGLDCTGAAATSSADAVSLRCVETVEALSCAEEGGGPEPPLLLDCPLLASDTPLYGPHLVVCAVANAYYAQVWIFVWYYPPGVYQVWCFLTHECPCPHCDVTEADRLREAWG